MTVTIGELIDKLDSIARIINLPLRDAKHLERVRYLLPELVADFKTAYVEVFGVDLWDAAARQDVEKAVGKPQ